MNSPRSKAKCVLPIFGQSRLAGPGRRARGAVGLRRCVEMPIRTRSGDPVGTAYRQIQNGHAQTSSSQSGARARSYVSAFAPPSRSALSEAKPIAAVASTGCLLVADGQLGVTGARPSKDQRSSPRAGTAMAKGSAAAPIPGVSRELSADRAALAEDGATACNGPRIHGSKPWPSSSAAKNNVPLTFVRS